MGRPSRNSTLGFKMIPKGFRCSDKPIQKRNKGCTLARTALRPNKTLHDG